MANLGETAVVARKAIRYGGMALVFLMVGRVVLGMAMTYWKSIHPDPPPPPDVKFGKLPQLLFPQKDQPTLTYTLETSTGGLPSKLSTQYKAFFMPIKKPSLLAYDYAKATANKLDFILEPKKLSETDYRWDYTDPIPTSLTMNIITGAFVLDKRWAIDPSYKTPTVLYTEEQIVNLASGFLSRLSLFANDLEGGKHTLQNYVAEQDELKPAVSLSQAQFVRVNFYRADVNKTPVVSPYGDKGLISTVMAMQKDDKKQFVRVEYNYFPVDLEQSASYPIISVSEAWQRMQTGGGFVAKVQGGVTNVVVRNIYLAYYDSDIPQQFLQPIYVFEGDGDFQGYVPAVADAWVE